jgi:hypothetical protein
MRALKALKALRALRAPRALKAPRAMRALSMRRETGVVAGRADGCADTGGPVSRGTKDLPYAKTQVG